MKTPATVGWFPLHNRGIALFFLERGAGDSPRRPLRRRNGLVILSLAVAAWAPVALAVWSAAG